MNKRNVHEGCFGPGLSASIRRQQEAGDQLTLLILNAKMLVGRPLLQYVVSGEHEEYWSCPKMHNLCIFRWQTWIIGCNCAKNVSHSFQFKIEVEDMPEFYDRISLLLSTHRFFCC